MSGVLHGFYAVAISTLLLAAQTADPTVLVKEAQKLSREGREEEALARYREALARAPDSFDANLGAGVAADLAGTYDAARRYLTNAIETAHGEQRVEALTAMAVSYAFSRDPANAAKFYQQVFDSQMATSAFGNAAESANALGRIYLESGDPDNAVKWYQTGYETARRQPDMPGPQLDLWDLRWAHAQARIAARRGRAADARRQLEVVESILAKGTNPEQQIQYPYLAGYVAFYLKDYPTAIAELQKADQSDPFILALLAQAYEQAGDRTRARESYRKVLTSTSHTINNAFARPLAQKMLAGR